jgi:hypothetical protein
VLVARKVLHRTAIRASPSCVSFDQRPASEVLASRRPELVATPAHAPAALSWTIVYRLNLGQYSI